MTAIDPDADDRRIGEETVPSFDEATYTSGDLDVDANAGLDPVTEDEDEDETDKGLDEDTW